jgi:hypothetical protein
MLPEHPRKLPVCPGLFLDCPEQLSILGEYLGAPWNYLWRKWTFGNHRRTSVATPPYPKWERPSSYSAPLRRRLSLQQQVLGSVPLLAICFYIILLSSHLVAAIKHGISPPFGATGLQSGASCSHFLCSGRRHFDDVSSFQACLALFMGLTVVYLY